MKRLLRWIGITLACLAGLAIIAYGILYLISARKINRVYDIPTVAIAVPTDTAAVAEGKRLATIRGCFAGCHGKQIEGAVLFDMPIIARLVAPNLSVSVRQYTDTQLATIIRRGLRPDGHSTVAMPAEAFVYMTDADVGRIIAFLKSMPLVDGPGPSLKLGPLGRIGLGTGQFEMTAETIVRSIAPPEATSEQTTQGRYLSQTICAECHGTDLRGASNPDFTSPNLQSVAAYSPEAFTQLLRAGVALGDRQLDTMSPWARDCLSSLNDAEIAALYSYLHAMTAS